ncbi:hypothetical protein [Nocardia sp. NPDC051570]|uniref:hypothetical protein n=1 Tax=Nocardia sp. NPDC051570 TaxID=3364324 RepID=UPI0037994D3A
MAGIRVALAALPFAIAVGCVGLAHAEPGPVQPGVTTPTPPDSDEPTELRAAAPQSPTPAPAPRPRPTTPDKTETPPPPPPRSVHIGDFEAPVPDGVPDAVVQGLQNAINPTPPPPKP